jgi:hypothetical protein
MPDFLKQKPGDEYTSAPVSMPCRADADRACAEFYRLPKSGNLDPIFQLSRSKWNQLILPCEANGYRPPIRSVVLRQKGAVRGVRLIVAAAAHAYFAKLVAEAEADDGGAK